MTDEQIIKAFKICNSENLGCEDGCPFNEICKKDNGKLYRAIIDLIERQQAEIDELKAYNESLINGQITLQEMLPKAISDKVIKEFTKKLEGSAILVEITNGNGKQVYQEVVTFIEIERIKHEMTEEGK